MFLEKILRSIISAHREDYKKKTLEIWLFARLFKPYKIFQFKNGGRKIMKRVLAIVFIVPVFLGIVSVVLADFLDNKNDSYLPKWEVGDWWIVERSGIDIFRKNSDWSFTSRYDYKVVGKNISRGLNVLK